MSRAILIFAGLVGAAWLTPLHAQDWSKFTFKMGGGISTPLNPTAAYTGVSGNFVLGAGYNIDRKNAIVGEFLWSGLPSNLFVLHPVALPSSDIKLYSLTANYRRQMDFTGSPFGLYLMAGGGWYERLAKLNQDFVVPAGTPCYPIYTWWGYGCSSAGYVYSQTVAAAPRAFYLTTNHPKLDALIHERLAALGVSFKEQTIGNYHLFYALSRKVDPKEIGLGDVVTR